MQHAREVSTSPGRCKRRRLAIVGEVGREPALDLFETLSLAPSVVLDLLTPDTSDTEVTRRRVRQVDSADACRRCHGAALGELHSRALRTEQSEQLALLGVVRAGRVAERRPDAAVALLEQLFVRQALLGRIPGPARALVQVLGVGLRQPVGEGLDQDRLVVVLFSLLCSISRAVLAQPP